MRHRWRLAAALVALLLLRGDMFPDASNAKLPQARANLLYTPPACDGKQASDGVMTAASAALSSSTASFAAADVGKRVLVAGAGSGSVFQSYTIAAAGSGYRVSDVITLTGGTFTAQAKLVVLATGVGGAVTEVMMWSPYASVGTYSAVPANPVATTAGVDPSAGTGGTGTGLTLNVTWKQSSLSTTIASVTDATHATLAVAAGTTVSGAVYGYGTDYTAEITAALTDGAVLPTGICGHLGQINLMKKQHLTGSGGVGANQDYRSILMWLGPSGGIQIKGGTTTTNEVGITLGGFAIDGMCSAATGIWFNGVSEATVHPITVRRHIQMGIMEDAASATTNNVGYIKWHQPFIAQANSSCNGLGDYTAGLVYGPGAAVNGDVFQNDYYGLSIQSKNAPAFLCGNSDSDRFYNFVLQTGTGTGPAMDALGSTTPGHGCRDHQFDLTAAGGVIKMRGQESGYTVAKARRLQINWNQSSGNAAFVDETGTSRWGANNNGRFFNPKLLATRFSGLPPSPVDGTLGYITDSPVTSAGALVTVGAPDPCTVGVDCGSLALLMFKGLAPVDGCDDDTIPCTNGGWHVILTTDAPQKIGMGCQTFAKASAVVEHTSGDLFCISDSTVAQWGGLVAGGGTFRVLAMASSPTNTFRVIGAIGVTTTRLTTTNYAAISATCNAAVEGQMYAVTDSTTAVFNATMTGSGSNHVIGYCNGTAWVVH